MYTGVAQDFATLGRESRLAQARDFYRAYEMRWLGVESVVTRHEIDCDFIPHRETQAGGQAKHFENWLGPMRYCVAKSTASRVDSA